MRKILTFLSILLLNFTMLLHGESIQLKDITAGIYKAKSVSQAISSNDGQYFFRPNTDNTKIIKYSYKTGLPVDTILDIGHAKGVSLSLFNGFKFSPDETKILLFTDVRTIYRRSFVATYYWYDIKSNTIYNIKQKIRNPLFSPNSKNIAYVADNDIWLYNFEKDNHLQITTDGKTNKIINGATDWVYEEEFATTSIISFSPNSKFLSYVRFDESKVEQFSFQVFNKQLYPSMDTFKYPKAGENNSSVSCLIYDLETKSTKNINLPSESIEYIPHIDFFSDNNLAIMTLNREQNDFRMYYYNPYSSVLKLVLEEKDKRYVDCDFIQSIRFIEDGFLYMSERDGFSHIYYYGLDGTIKRQLTKGRFDVIQMLAYDSNDKILFYQAADTGPLERNIFKYNFKKNKHQKISEFIGYNSASFSNNGQYFINTWSDINTPSITTLYSAKTGTKIRDLEKNENLVHKLSILDRPSKEFLKIKGVDGIEMNAYIMKPHNFDATTKYPLVMVQYSGPNSQQVLNQFNIDWTDYLVNQGYLVVAVDGRGTGARGEDFRKCSYLNLGIYESDDQIEAAKYFSTLPYIDSNNISIWGWSFGGYNVLMSLSRSKNVFKNGIAIAPVTDWRFYDSIYTERYMRTPQMNEKGYDKGSPLKLVSSIEGNLLLIHGSADDNVHFQNSMEYITALVDNDKQFDLFVFPDLNHSLLGSNNRFYLYKKIINFLNTK